MPFELDDDDDDDDDDETEMEEVELVEVDWPNCDALLVCCAPIVDGRSSILIGTWYEFEGPDGIFSIEELPPHLLKNVQIFTLIF